VIRRREARDEERVVRRREVRESACVDPCKVRIGFERCRGFDHVLQSLDPSSRHKQHAESLPSPLGNFSIESDLAFNAVDRIERTTNTLRRAVHLDAILQTSPGWEFQFKGRVGDKRRRADSQADCVLRPKVADGDASMSRCDVQVGDKVGETSCVFLRRPSDRLQEPSGRQDRVRAAHRTEATAGELIIGGRFTALRRAIAMLLDESCLAQSL